MYKIVNSKNNFTTKDNYNSNNNNKKITCLYEVFSIILSCLYYVLYDFYFLL